MIYYKEPMTAHKTEKRTTETTEKRVIFHCCLLFLAYLSLKNNLVYVWKLQV